MDFKENIIVIGDNDTVSGFALAGVAEVIPATSQNCEELFLKTITRTDAGVVILQDDFARLFSHKTKKLIDSIARPVIVTVPGKAEVLGANKSGNIQELVKRAIGIELKA